MKIIDKIHKLGLILIVIGTILLFFFIHEVIISTSSSNFVGQLNLFAEFSLLFSTIFLFGGIALVCMEIAPSMKDNVTLETHKIRFAIGEITKEQYEQMKKEFEK